MDVYGGNGLLRADAEGWVQSYKSTRVFLNKFKFLWFCDMESL